MNCDEAHNLKEAYADGELDAVQSMGFEQHLASCHACSRSVQNLRNLKSGLQSAELYFETPSALRRQIRASLKLNGERPRRTTLAWWPMLKFALPVLVAVGLVVFGFRLTSGYSSEERLRQEVTADHVRSLMANHLTDIASTDQHTVKPWFDGKIDFAPPVVDLVGHDFPLVGGRLDYLGNRPVAALVYQHGKHFINVFVSPIVSAASTEPSQAAASQGYWLTHWNQSGMRFWAISDMNPSSLLEFARYLQSQVK